MTEGGLILTFNAGSSTVKLGFYRVEGARATALGRGVIDFRDEPLEFRVTLEGRRLTQPLPGADAQDMGAVLARSLDWLGGHLPLDRLRAIGHRVVHGGDIFTGPARIDPATLARIEDLASLAPLHQPQSLRLIHAMRSLLPDTVQTASFDTAFHATNPPIARRFAIPRALHDRGVKRYGFHGLSYHFIAGALRRMGLPSDARVVAAHLGSGASLCGMAGGRSLDTSMGFSTIDGIPMATRSGTLDPGVLLHLLGPMGMSLAEVENMLYRESGLLGVSGIDADSRELLESAAPEAAEAIELFCFRIAGEVARLAATLGGLDALVFTAGIGENQPRIRAMVADRLAWLGVALDAPANAANRIEIGADRARVRCLVIPTDEEQVIADQAVALLSADRG
ncbi:acetate/propionate family kinase [Paracoccus siganidrum]|uniref:Acetate kinase n=1 Tax=Paracoccus siganidrum TaxID=1276757 RepID=A0A419A568_9RHOB|nr:acetate/propionate family kinase [Paracoccus siganidrum]RJL10714.1 acetate/propionate family kinase [Paracoccus siganidrum]RMC28970.1 acetate/propionate family kinase [Paracoccus siganidrum]